ncbi:MAG: hypothetical protein ABI921_11720 [Panacibacter sp.]
MKPAKIQIAQTVIPMLKVVGQQTEKVVPVYPLFVEPPAQSEHFLVAEHNDNLIFLAYTMLS